MQRRDAFPFLDTSELRSIAIVCHRNADADAYLSAYAMAELLNRISPKVAIDIITPDGMGALAKRLREVFPHQTLEESEREYDLFIAVDIGHVELLKDWLPRMTGSRAFKVLVDHHPVQKNSFYDRMVVDEKSSSTSEIVYHLFKELGITVEKNVAQAILIGIMADSQHLAIAGDETIRVCVQLADLGADIDEARRTLRSRPDYSEVIAKIKGTKRSNIFRLGDWVAVTSHVGSFQAQVARALIVLGADVAVVGGEVGGETRVSLRAGQRFYDLTGLRLGIDVAEVVAGKDGYGGGHATAASFTSKLTEEEAVQGSLDILSRLLKEKVVEID